MRDAWRDDADDDADLWSERSEFDNDLDDSRDDTWAEDSVDETDLRECPMCGCDVYADAEQCPLCGEWFIRNHTVWDGRPLWFVMLALAGIAAVILSMFMFVI